MSKPKRDADGFYILRRRAETDPVSGRIGKRHLITTTPDKRVRWNESFFKPMVSIAASNKSWEYKMWNRCAPYITVDKLGDFRFYKGIIAKSASEHLSAILYCGRTYYISPMDISAPAKLLAGITFNFCDSQERYGPYGIITNVGDLEQLLYDINSLYSHPEEIFRQAKRQGYNGFRTSFKFMFIYDDYSYDSHMGPAELLLEYLHPVFTKKDIVFERR